MSRQIPSQKSAASAKSSSATQSTVLQRQHTLGAHHRFDHKSDLGVRENAPALVQSVLNSPGRPLDAGTRASMEPLVGHDLSRVRVHTDHDAAESARSVNANAYTAGSHVVFGAGKYTPGTAAGRQLMAHELTHVVQQASGPVDATAVAPGLRVSDPANRFEKAAAANATRLMQEKHPENAPGRSPLPMARNGSELYVQRQTPPQPDVGLANAGAVAGIVGGIAGVLALGLAAVAYFRPPDALNPMPASGGLTINPNPFGFNTMQNPAQEPASNRQRYAAAARSAPEVRPVLDLRTDNDNHAVFNLARRTDGYNIIDASIRTGTMQGYRGGSRGSSANINFTQTQIAPAPSNLFAPEPAGTASSPGGATGTQSATGTPAGAGAQSSGDTTAPQSGPAVAEVLVSYNGTNTKNDGPPQAFAGSFVVKGNGEVDVTAPEVTNGIGRADMAANVAEVDYRGPVGGGGGGSSGSLSPSLAPSGGGLLPNFNVPNPPILDRP